MSNPLFDTSEYQSWTSQSYRPDWRDTIDIDPAWDELDLNQNLEPSTQGADSNAPAPWQSAAAFTITLQSGQNINVQFVPSLEGELRMHSFNFIPINCEARWLLNSSNPCRNRLSRSE